MTWKFDRVDFYSRKAAMAWWKVQKFVFFSGNQVQFSWWRFSVVFVRRQWAVDV